MQQSSGVDAFLASLFLDFSSPVCLPRSKVHFDDNENVFMIYF